ncbi:hypothetical protein [uncultured Flavonifractor sp.]|uniref:hypothetical protein n=1 Tax=uncultured Flavonifractor sp. TaxID=1193534 RepID=UPI00260A4EE7|nr:hypothetical protein [uncultured Flavonifractor sp.]
MFDQKTYQETFSSLHASEDVLVEVMNMTHKSRKRAKWSRTAATAAAVLCGIVTAAAAVGFLRYENPAAMIHALFGENVSSGNGIVEYDEDGRLMTNLPAWERVPVDETLAQELIAPYIFAVGESAVCGDYTLNMEALLYDAATRAGMLYYTVENSNGVIGYEVFSDGELWWPAEAPIFTRVRGSSRAYLDTAMSSETKLYICTYFVADPSEKTICVGIGPGEDRSKVNDISLELPGDVGIAGVELADGAVYISPVSIQMDLASLGVDGDSIDSVTLYYADGSKYVVENEADFVSNYTYAVIDQEGSTLTYTFNRIVDTNSIASAEINGVMYE